MLNHESLRRRRKFDLAFLLLILIILIVIFTIFFIYYQFRTDAIKEDIKKGLPIKVLFIVSNEEKPVFFELFMYDANTKRGSILFLPANLGVIIESLKKVDAISVLYNGKGNKELLKELSKLLGTEINYFIDLSYKNVSRLVDLVGGIELFIPNPVNLKYGNKKILLPSGSVRLFGDKVLDFITYKDKHEPSIEVIGRKQKFLQSLLKSLSESNKMLLEGKPHELFKSFLKTNLSDRSVRTLLEEIAKMDSERLIFQRALGTIKEVEGKQLLFPHYDAELLKEKVKQTLKTIASRDVLSEEDLTVTIEILNGTKVNGLAARTREIYQSFGYDVISIGNTKENDYLNTVVLDRKGKIDIAKKVASIIHCERIYTRPDPKIDESIDVTIILGKDFDGRYCRK